MICLELLSFRMEIVLQMIHFGFQIVLFRDQSWISLLAAY